MRQALRQALAIGLAFACLASLSMFYEFYLRWYGRFENGRYFDPVESVVYHADRRSLLRRPRPRLRRPLRGHAPHRPARVSAALPAIVFAVLAAFGLSALLTRGDGPKREAARRAARLVRLAVTGTLAAGSAFLFYERYWIWRECFNELGRCYDGEAGVMLQQAGWIWGGLFLIFATLALWNLAALRRRRRP